MMQGISLWGLACETSLWTDSYSWQETDIYMHVGDFDEFNYEYEVNMI